MTIAILGTRGVPAAYGGFETFAEELSARLAARGHRVWVYGRPHSVAAAPEAKALATTSAPRWPAAGQRGKRWFGRCRPAVTPEHRGVGLIFLPSIRHKYFETVSHTFLSVLHLVFRMPSVEVALICNAANSAFSWMPRLVGTPTVVNVDGLERLRRKWNFLGRTYYRLSEWLSTWMPTTVVTDALHIQRYYREKFGKEFRFIPYGAGPPADTGTETIERLGLEPDKYLLYVSRLEPENNALLVVRAFENVAAGLRLAIVGDAPYASRYIGSVRETRDPRIVFPGAIYGAGYSQLRAHARAYVHATEVGGTHPALVEAMAAGLPFLYLDTAENREVAGDAGIAFTHSAGDLAGKMRHLLRPGEDAAAERRRLGEAARERALRLYDWEAVTSAYEQLFRELVTKNRQR